MIKITRPGKFIFILFSFIAIVSLNQNACIAQRDSANRHFNEDVEKIMKLKLIENLNLDETTADKFIDTYKENKKNIRSIMKDKKEVQKSIELDPSALDIGTKLDKWMEFDQKIVDSRKNYYRELQSFLTSEQIAKSIVLKNNLEKELRKELKKHRKSKKLDKPENGM